MKIPVILAQEPVAVPQAARMAPTNGSGLAELGRGLGHVATALTEAAEAKRTLAAKTEAALRKSEFDVGLATMDSNLRLTHSDPDAYLAAYTQGVQQLHARTLKNTQSPDAKALLGIELTRASGLHQVEAQKHYNSLYIGRAEGQLDTTQDNLKILLGTATTDEQRSEIYGRGIRNIDTMLPILGGKRTADKKISWRNDVLMDTETRQIQDDPLTWNAQRVQGVLPDDKILILENRATRAATAAEARIRKREEDFQKAVKADTEQLIINMERDASLGKLTEQAVDLRIDMRQITDAADARRLRALAVEGPNLRPSDPDLLSRIGLDAHSTTPNVSEMEIDRLQSLHQRGGKGINLKDAIAIKDRLRTTRNTLEQQGESQLVRDQNQAEQELRATLGIRPGILSEALKDDPIARLYGAGLTELRRRSRLFQKTDGGTEEPLAVLRDLLPRLQQTAGSGAQLKITEIRGLLTFPTRQALDAARASGQISQAQYEIERSRWLQIDDIESRVPLGPPAPPAARR